MHGNFSLALLIRVPSGGKSGPLKGCDREAADADAAFILIRKKPFL